MSATPEPLPRTLPPGEARGLKERRASSIIHVVRPEAEYTPVELPPAALEERAAAVAALGPTIAEKARVIRNRNSSPAPLDELRQTGRLAALRLWDEFYVARPNRTWEEHVKLFVNRGIEAAIRDAAKRERPHSEKRATEEKPAAGGMVDFATAPTWNQDDGKTAQWVAPDFGRWFVNSDSGDAALHAVTHAAAGLPDRERQVFEYRLRQGMSQGEAASAIGCSQQLVSRLEPRVIKKLRAVAERVWLCELNEISPEDRSKWREEDAAHRAGVIGYYLKSTDDTLHSEVRFAPRRPPGYESLTSTRCSKTPDRVAYTVEGKKKTQRCLFCDAIKPVADFYPSTQTRDGLSDCCRVCFDAWMVSYWARRVAKSLLRRRRRDPRPTRGWTQTHVADWPGIAEDRRRRRAKRLSH